MLLSCHLLLRISTDQKEVCPSASCNEPVHRKEAHVQLRQSQRGVPSLLPILGNAGHLMILVICWMLISFLSLYL